MNNIIKVNLIYNDNDFYLICSSPYKVTISTGLLKKPFISFCTCLFVLKSHAFFFIFRMVNIVFGRISYIFVAAQHAVFI